jgi:anti-anti-sigma regulatory factor
MALKMADREADGVSVVVLEGRIVLGEESNALREKLKSLIAEGKKKIILNMDNIKYIDSSAGDIGCCALQRENPGRMPYGCGMEVSVF